jgi:hypothetical protein
MNLLRRLLRFFSVGFLGVLSPFLRSRVISFLMRGFLCILWMSFITNYYITIMIIVYLFNDFMGKQWT